MENKYQQFNIGQYVILRGNCEENRNVATGKQAYLCHGKYSCDKKERGTDLVVIMKPVRKLVTKTRFIDDRIQKVQEWVSMVRCFSTKTHNVYEVNTAWADSFDKEEYADHLEFALLDAALNDSFNEMMEDELDNEYMDCPF